MSDRLAALLYRIRWPLSAIAVIGALVFIPAAQVLTRIDNDITAWFSREDPVFKEYERFRKEFGGTRTLIVAIEAKDGTIFTDDRFRFLEDATAEIERVELVQRAQSLANANIVSTGTDASRAAVRDGTSASCEPATRASQGVRSSPPVHASQQGGHGLRATFAAHSGEGQGVLAGRRDRTSPVPPASENALIFASHQGGRGLRGPFAAHAFASQQGGSSPSDDDAGDDGMLLVRPLSEVFREQGIDAVRRLAMRDDLIRGDLVSDDGRVAAIVVTFDEDRVDEVRAKVIGDVHRVVTSRLPRGLVAHFNGSLEISETYNRITLSNTERFTPPILLLTSAAIWLMFRSWRRTLLAMGAVLVSVLWTLGLYTTLGFTYNVLTSMLGPLVIVLAIADDVHIMQHFEHVRRHRDAEGAFKATVSHLFAPLLGASATTALGMLSLATSDVVAVRQFGIGAAIGIMVDFAISLVFMPTLLAWLEPETSHVAPHERHLIEPLRRVARFSTQRPKLVLGVAGVIGAITMAGISRLYVDTNHINFFSEDHPLSTSAAVIDEELSGIYSFNILLEGEEDSLKSPDALQRMDRVSNELRALPYVKKVTSVADYVKRINRELHDGDPAASVIPADRSAIAQELFVFGLSDNGRVELERMAASDYSRAQISVKLASMSSDLVFAQIEKAEEIVRRVFAGTAITPTVTGSGRLFATLDHYLVNSQLSSFGTAFVTVFGVIFLVFRSARYGVLAIIPNLFPVLAVLGMMGWLDISMNVATVMVASVALGVVDDDTIHFINRFRKDRERGATVDRAIEAATIYEGRAALTTTLINSAGYAVLLLSEYRPSAWFGGLLALTMVTAFLAEVFVLPASIKLVPWFQGRSVRMSREDPMDAGLRL
jgi:hypothetical protein